MLAEQFEGTTADITEENIQSRARGLTLMALSNKFGYMVLTTGNKSEMAVGYATLYGDMCGGFNALKDIYKTDVFELAKWRNTIGKVIPENIITKPPTAELRPDQKDEDSLPAYEILDGILRLLIEERRSAEYIIKQGYDSQTVHHVTALVIGTEYKRRQAPPGVKTTNLAFGRDRRYPITNRFTF
jgi:NAD+ synthase